MAAPAPWHGWPTAPAAAWISVRTAGPPSLNGLATVDHEGVASGERRCVRAQPQDGGSDFLGRAHAADRLLRDHRFPSFLGAPREPIHHLGLDDPGADGIDADVSS